MMLEKKQELKLIKKLLNKFLLYLKVIKIFLLLFKIFNLKWINL